MCKICKNTTIKKLIKNIEYNYCPVCGFLSKDDKYIVSSNEEFFRYQQHQNDDDLKYINYQEKFYNSIKDFVGEKVLDYGCGSGHTLSNILEKNGHKSSYYDLYFYPFEEYKKSLYDAIILEEVIEHLKDPLSVLKQLYSLLEKGGNFIIRTNLIPPNVFDGLWWYLRDITHISFFDLKTFEFLSKVLNLQIIYCNDKDLVILKKV